MNLSCLTTFLTNMPAYRRLVYELERNPGEHGAGVLDSAKPCVVASLYQELKLPALLVVPSSEEAKRFYEELSVWCSNDCRIMWFPELDNLPYENMAPDPFSEQRRLQLLSSLAADGAGNNRKPLLIIASALALVRKTFSYNEFQAACQTIKKGMHIDPLALLSKGNSLGYRRENLVDAPGTMSQRGGILDIYPSDSERPVRIEFFGNEIDSLRLFDPVSQRSQESIDSITLIPAHENTGSNTSTLMDYLPSDSFLVMSEPAEIARSVTEMDDQAGQLRRSQIEKGDLPEDYPVPYLNYTELKATLDRIKQRLFLTRWPKEKDNPCEMDFAPAPGYGGQLKTFLEDVKRLLGENRRVVVVSHQAARLSELLQNDNIFATPLSCLDRPPLPGSIVLIQGSLSEGWSMAEDLILLTDAEIFGFVKQQRLAKRKPAHHKKFFFELSPGDYAVHIDHGIARFTGMTKMRVNEMEREYLTLEYAAGDRIHVPIDQADRVSRYVGSGGEPPVLSRLSTKEWERTKQKAKESARDMAMELLDLYAAREVVSGYAFSPDTVWQQEMEASFPYVETPDQMEAVQRVKEDMEKSKPMDRLICGDVGYGKTEVALRAAFKAVMDGKQVAILVPTTVLAQQHFTTFSKRMAAFPTKVEMLSRFRSAKEQKDILKSLKDGDVDICIGTHRLLQKDVIFKDLGLVIIDEEQRFGVAHKERLKQLRKKVDVLTLSATPIPRTLHMSLVGVRDMSTIDTPPEERYPIKNHVGEYSETLIRDAIVRELERKGQVFFVHNRVQNITRIAGKLQELVPEAKIAIGHGQMPEDALEKTMLDFVKGEVDILVCTTIIESGLDIPNANTLIINEADKLGLAQLYQLRGRIGRSSNRAHAYFLYNKEKHLTPVAVKRLETIFENTDLGAGFRIAMKDLEIRGAGNLLGSEQSGNIAAVGFDLYCQLLSDAIEDLKTKPSGEDKSADISLVSLSLPAVDLPLSAQLSEDYVADLSTRLSLYRRLARIDSIDEAEQLAGELKDRFGPLPPAAQNLLYIVNIRALAAQVGVQSIFKEGKHIKIIFKDGVRIDRESLSKTWKGLVAGSTQVWLDQGALGVKWQNLLREVIGRLAEFQFLAPSVMTK